MSGKSSDNHFRSSTRDLKMYEGNEPSKSSFFIRPSMTQQTCGHNGRVSLDGSVVADVVTRGFVGATASPADGGARSTLVGAGTAAATTEIESRGQASARAIGPPPKQGGTTGGEPEVAQ